MILRPDMRYVLFLATQELVQLRQDVQSRDLTDCDGRDVVETLATIEDHMLRDYDARVGTVFFDEAEAAAFENLLAIPVDSNALMAEWQVRHEYLTSPEFMLVLDAAVHAMGEMMRPGRGLPGWDSEAIDHRLEEDML